jgi:glycosyltransferase involved in cell wall biosynthesis
MNNNISIVVVCKNEAGIIDRLLKNVKGVTDDVVVYDNGSTDGTQEIILQHNAKLHEGEWLGFGPTKQKAVALAKNDWILFMDADELLDEELKSSLEKIQLYDPLVVYDISFKNFIGSKHVKYGEWGGDHHIRIFNRTQVNWDDAAVHEELILPHGVKVSKLKGYLLHYTMNDSVEYSQKMVKYALLNAQKYFDKGKRSSWIKRHLSPMFTFIKYYFFHLGFLDGWEGFLTARMTSYYTFVKYARLYELWKKK